MAKLKDNEKEFLLNKYSSLGYSKKGAEIRLNRFMKLMVISAATVIV